MADITPIGSYAGEFTVIQSGDTVNPTALGAGTPNSTTFLRGDKTWASIGAGVTWTTISSANVNPAVTNTGYVMETGGTLRTVTLPASCAAGFYIAVNSSGGQVRIVSNGNTIDQVGAGNDLILDDNSTAALVCKTTGNLEILYGGSFSSTGGVSEVDTTYTYDGSNRLSTVTDSYGTKTMTYDGSGVLTAVTGTGIYVSKTLTYNGSGLLTNVDVA